MDGIIREFALQMLRKLQKARPQPVTKPSGDVDVDMDGTNDTKPQGETESGYTLGNEPANSEVPAEDAMDVGHKDGEEEDSKSSDEDLVHTPYLPERIELPAKKSHVLQHVELLFALSVKVPEFLDK